MSSGATIAITVAVVVVLAAMLLVGTARRRDTHVAIGSLRRETVRRDRGRPSTPSSVRTMRGDVERAPAQRRRELVHTTEVVQPAYWAPPDPETIGVSRRQFFNRATVTLMSAGIGTFSAAAMVAFVWPSPTGGFGSVVSVGSLADIQAKIAAGGGFAY